MMVKRFQKVKHKHKGCDCKDKQMNVNLCMNSLFSYIHAAYIHIHIINIYSYNIHSHNIYSYKIYVNMSAEVYPNISRRVDKNKTELRLTHEDGCTQ